MITSAGVGSGIDIESIISQLMTLEREPINQIESRKNELDVKISAIGSLKSMMAELSDSAEAISNRDTFGGLEGVSSDEDIFTFEKASGTQPEEHQIDVLELAQAHRLTSESYADGQTSLVNQGTYDFSSGDESFSVVIDDSNDTLLDLRDAINNSTDNNSIRASVLNLSSGSRLILTATNSGIDNEITSSGNFTELTEARDARLTIDGFDTTSPSNLINELVPGISLSLKGIGKATLETNRNTASYREVLDNFVSKYNQLNQSIDSLSDNQLRSDGTLRSIQSEISRVFFTPVQTANEEQTILGLGLTFDRSGELSINDDQFNSAMENNFNGFLLALTDPDDGLSIRITNALERYTDTDGLLAAKEDSLETRKGTLDLQSERLEYRIEQVEQRYRRQFSAMDVLVSQLQSTSSYLTQQLGSLTNNGNS